MSCKYLNDVTPLWHDVFMLIEVTQRVQEGLAELIRLVNDADTPTAHARRVLEESKAFGAQVAMLQADAAALVATRERHGDSGAGVLAQAAGLSKRDAASQVNVAEKLQSMPAVRNAVQNGRISLANAKTLATASDKTITRQVQQDSQLLEKAAALPPEQFSREAGRWTARRQGDGGEDTYRRQRARRRLSIWDGDDGMVHLRGELDPVTGAKVRKRFLQEAERLRRADLHSPGGERRNSNQRMADALDTLSANPGWLDASGTGNGVDTDTGAGKGSSGTGKGRSVSGKGSSGTGKGRSVSRKGGRCGGGCGKRPSADIVIVQHLSADGTRAFAEIAGGGIIPKSVLEEHFCNAEITGVVFDGEGKPLWQGTTKRTATPAQMRALEALYGACGGCGAPFVICQAHHIHPVSQGGPTDIDNLMPLCWGCHDKVHYHHWRVVPSGDLRTIEPPERIRYGPAHAPDPPPAHGPAPKYGPARCKPIPITPSAPAMADPAPHARAKAHRPEPLFTIV